MPPPKHFESRDHRYSFLSDCYGSTLYFQNQLLWHHASESAFGTCVVSNAGEVLQWDSRHWKVLARDGSVLAFQKDRPGVWSPLRFSLDPPTDFWVAEGKLFLQLSQGDVYEEKSGSWQYLRMGTTRQMLRPPARKLAAKDWRAWAQFQDSESAFLPEPSPRIPVFRNLDDDSLAFLQGKLKAGSPAAALALGLGGYAQFRPQLLQAAHQWRSARMTRAAQHALILLDGEAAAPELADTLDRAQPRELLELYERVPCPQAVPHLVKLLPAKGDPGVRRALKAQTRLDLGDDPAAWKVWIQNRDRVGDPEARLLWMAQREQTKPLVAELAKVPRLVGMIELGGGEDEQFVVRDGRLIHAGGSIQGRALEWSLRDGRPLVEMPEAAPPSGHFLWNSSRQILYWQVGLTESALWQGGQEVFRHWTEGRVGESFLLFAEWPEDVHYQRRGQVPNWLLRGLNDDARFSADGRYLQGSARNQFLRIEFDAQGQVVGSRTWPGSGLGHDLVLSPDQTLLAGSDGMENLITGKTLPQKSLEGPLFNPDSQTLVRKDPLRLLDREGKCLAQVDNEPGFFGQMAFSPSGDRLALGNGKILDAKTLEVLLRLPQAGTSLAFDETGRLLAQLDRYGNVRIYDLRAPAPNLDGVDPRLYTELWTGNRLLAGGSQALTAAEFWQRKQRLAETPRPPSLEGLFQVLGGLLRLGLLTVGIFVLRAKRGL